MSHQQTFGEHGHKSNELSYHKAVEELMNKEAQDADDGIQQMVDKEHVHHDCFVASSERPLVPHKTYKKHQLVEKLKMEEKQKKLVRVKRQEQTHSSKTSLCSLTLTAPSKSSAGPRPIV